MENQKAALLKGYKREERTGSGVFGAVYRARQSTIDREVAIKIILSGNANNPDFTRRFESKAHLIARLERPNITSLYDFWRDPDGAYLVMRHWRGGSVWNALPSGKYEVHAMFQLLELNKHTLFQSNPNNIH